MARRSRGGKKPFYTRWWFILLVVLLLFGSPSGGKKKTEDRQQEAVEIVSKSPAPAQNTQEPEQKAPESEQIAPAVAAASLLTLADAKEAAEAPDRALPAEETPEPTPEPTSEPTPEPTPEPPPEPTPEPTPEPASQLHTYVLNTNTMRFHNPGCKSVKKMKDSNKVTVEAAREDLIAQGYSPCGNCHP